MPAWPHWRPPAGDMTHGDSMGGGEAAAGATARAASPAADSAAWAPLRQRAFRWLSLGVLTSSVGTWMQTVGAQWLVVHGPDAAVLVSLVQAANTLPVMLQALPGGVLADSFDRRWLLCTVQAHFSVVGVLLAVLTTTGRMPPPCCSRFTFALGTGVALQLPARGASIPELVPRSQLRAASRLDLVNINLSRAIGPALAGLVSAHLGGVPANRKSTVPGSASGRRCLPFVGTRARYRHLHGHVHARRPREHWCGGFVADRAGRTVAVEPEPETGPLLVAVQSPIRRPTPTTCSPVAGGRLSGSRTAASTARSRPP